MNFDKKNKIKSKNNKWKQNETFYLTNLTYFSSFEKRRNIKWTRALHDRAWYARHKRLKSGTEFGKEMFYDKSYL